MHRLLLAFCSCLAVACAAAFAEHRGPCTSNGCGPSGWRGKLVPERFLGCVFTPACNAHDICYGQCSSCGPHHGKRMCIVPAQKRALKDACDKALESDIQKLNDGSWRCWGFAKIYYIAVSGFGDEYFGQDAPPQNLIARAREDVEALAQFAGFEDRATTERRINQIENAALVLRRADSGFANRFAVTPAAVPGAEPQLRFESRTPVPTLTIPRDGMRLEQKHLLNGIDVTKMRIDGRVPDLDQIIRRTPNVPIDRLDRTFRFERVQ